MKKFSVMFFAAVLLITSGNMGWVSAQETDEETDAFTLEEITVTAQKREENVQSVSTSMEVISGAEMAELGKTDINDILSTISGALITKGTDGLKVSLRGMSQDGAPSGGLQHKNPTVALNTDGVYSNRNSGGQNLFDIERVEVLYGPQSTMYASATPGGIVNIITKNPALDTYSANATLEVGNYNLLHMEGAANAPITENTAFRAAFSASSHDGYLSNGADDEDSKVARMKLLYEPSEKFSMVLTGEMEKDGGQGYAGVELFIDDSDVDDPWHSETELAGNPRLTDKYKLYAHIVWDTGLGELTVIPTYTDRDFSYSTTSQSYDDDGNLESTSLSTSDGTGKEEGIEARMASYEDSFIKWIAGVNWYKQNDFADNNTYTDGELTNWQGRRIRNQMLAFFGNVTYPVTEKFRASVGARYTLDNTYRYNEIWPAPANRVNPEIFDVDFNPFSVKVGAEYDVSESSMLYADGTTAYRVTIGTDRDGDPLPAEKMKAFTLGSKNRFWNNRLQINAAAFYYYYTDKLATTFVTTIVDDNGNGIRDWDDLNGNGIFDPDTELYTENDTMMDEAAKAIGELEMYGIDIQTSTILTERDKLDISISYLSKTWGKLLYDFWDITNDIGIDDLDLSGKTATFAPEWNVSLSYEHNFSLPSGGNIVPRLDARYQSDYVMYYLDYVASMARDGSAVSKVWVKDMVYQEPYTLYDFTTVYSHPGGKWTLTGYVKNITNYPVKKYINISGSGAGSSLMIGPPRTIGATMTVRF